MLVPWRVHPGKPAGLPPLEICLLTQKAMNHLTNIDVQARFVSFREGKMVSNMALLRSYDTNQLMNLFLQVIILIFLTTWYSSP